MRHIGFRMRRQLRFATTLCGEEAERDHLAFASCSIPSACNSRRKQLSAKPLVDVLCLFGAGLRESTYMLAEKFDLLCLRPPWRVFPAWWCLAIRVADARLAAPRKLLSFFRNGRGFAETAVGGRLIHHFLDGDGGQSGFVDHAASFRKRQSLNSYQHGEDGQRTGFCHPDQDGSLPVRSPLRHKRNSRRMR